MACDSLSQALGGLSVLVLALTATAGATAIAFFISASTGVVLVGALHPMKLANRSAQRRIAAGEFPDFNALGPEKNKDGTTALPEGPAEKDEFDRDQTARGLVREWKRDEV